MKEQPEADDIEFYEALGLHPEKWWLASAVRLTLAEVSGREVSKILATDDFGHLQEYFHWYDDDKRPWLAGFLDVFRGEMDNAQFLVMLAECTEKKWGVEIPRLDPILLRSDASTVREFVCDAVDSVYRAQSPAWAARVSGLRIK